MAFPSTRYRSSQFRRRLNLCAAARRRDSPALQRTGRADGPCCSMCRPLSPQPRNRSLMPQDDLKRRELVTIDVSSVQSVRQLHERLAEALGFPDFYGMNWDAFWDSITGLVEMPRRFVIVGWSNITSRWPKDAEAMVKCLRD